ncbi:MAG: hypothetical protein Q9M43_01840 [Sulfurimonas sp.]|nr:hypothetical protein [Sulfurimonas sp.]
MNSILLSTEVLVGLFVESLLILTLSYALFQGLLILQKTKLASTREVQDALDKKSYLMSTLVSLAFVVKVLLLVFFTYTLDELTHIIPGAMCVTGVLGTNQYGTPLFLLKVAILLSSSLWLVMSKKDFSKRILVFLVLYILIVSEFILTLSFLSNISTESIASCCSVKYISEDNPIPFDLSQVTLVQLFYLFLYICNA